MISSMALLFSPSCFLLTTTIFLVVDGYEEAPVHSSGRKRHTAIVVSSVVAASLFLCFLYVCYYRRKQRRRLDREIFGMFSSANLKPCRDGTVEARGQASKYAKWDLEKATDSFSVNNIIGSSDLGTVYRGVRRYIHGQTTFIAVKVLNMETSPQVEQFLSSDVAVLNRIKHRNLVEVLGSSWPGDQFVALVTKFVPNGNLETAVHGSDEERIGLPLDLTKRLNIMISTAQTIIYLHNLCNSAFVHCHLRPTNILFDENFEVRVSDYGTANLLWSHLQQESRASSSPSGATMSYIAPEVAVMTQVGPQADVYSFGVILMEVLTKRRPTVSLVSEGGEKISLRQWVANGINDGGLVTVLDLVLTEKMSEREGEKLLNLLKISLLCTKEIPEDRPSMSQLLSWLVNCKQGRMDCISGF